MKNGNPVLRNCGWLAKRGVSRQATLCTGYTTYANYSSAKGVCLSTCKNAGTQCQEDKSAKFLLKMKNGNPILRNCGWLAKKGVSKQANLCTKSATYDNYSSAKGVCFSTCKNKTFIIEDATENKSAKFLLRTKTANGTRKPVKRTCTWLGKKTDERIAKVCSKTKKGFGFEPAKDVCPITCA
jgi:hypothetical protein